MKNELKEKLEDIKFTAKALMTDEQLTKCKLAIHTAAVAAGLFGAMPIPFADALPISAAQITMVIEIGKAFDRKITKSAARAIITATISSILGRNIVKFIPVLGWVISASVAVTITEIAGWTTAVDFAREAAYADDEEETEEEETEKETEKEETEEEESDS